MIAETFLHLPIPVKIVAGAFGLAAVQWFGPTWLQVIVYVSVALLAIGIIWAKFVRPVARLIILLDKALPLLESMVDAFGKWPNAFEQLGAILREFGTDSGTTLRDVVNDLKQSAEENKTASGVLSTNAETARKLAERDREIMAELFESVRILRAKQRENTSALGRVEEGDKNVARDLAASKQRADNTEGDAGAAADAAAKPG